MEGSAGVTYGWRTSSYSNGGGSTCIEAGHIPGAILIRDTTDRAGAVLAISPTAWRTLLAEIRA